MKNSTLQTCFGRIGFLLLFFGVSGCFAHKVQSPMLNTQENPEITAKLRNVVLAIEYPNNESKKHMVDGLVRDLRKTELFREVGDKGKLSGAPDLILTSLEISQTDPLQGCFLGFEGGMLFTIATFGVIPEICHIDRVISFQVSRVGKEEKIHVTLNYKIGFVAGWVAIAYNLSPKWTWMPQPQEKKEIQVLKSAFWQKGDEILEILR